jgi:WD40 repeat protein
VASRPAGPLLALGLVPAGEGRAGKHRATSKQRATLSGHVEYIWSVAYSPDGRTLASGSWDRTIKLWQVATGKVRATLEGHGGEVLWSIRGVRLRVDRNGVRIVPSSGKRN